MFVFGPEHIATKPIVDHKSRSFPELIPPSSLPYPIHHTLLFANNETN